MREDGVGYPDVVLVSKVREGAYHVRVLLRFQEEDPHHAKAVRTDDAVVRVDVWNQRVAEQLTKQWASTQTQSHLEPTFVKALEVMRNGLLQQWKLKVSRDFYKWYEVTGCLHPKYTDILTAGKLTITKAEQALFLEWDMGSVLFFWRSPEHYQDIARKGIAPMFDSDPPCSLEEQPEYKDQKIREKVRDKLEKVVAKGYIKLTHIKFVETIMYMFHVAKGDDIFMVYDDSKSGLNAVIYAPWFALPTAELMT